MSNKYNTGGTSMFNKDNSAKLNTTIFYYGIVMDNIDEQSANRVKVRIGGIDDHLKDEDLPLAFPLLQKFFYVIPKVGETVMIFIPNVKNQYIDRMYLGPIISQPQMLFADNELYSSKSTLDSGVRENRPTPLNIPEAKGVYPVLNDVAIQGRDNTDMLFRNKEILIRAGKHDTITTKGEIPAFNKANPTFIQLKHDVVLKSGDNRVEEERGGVINIVSNKINLLGHKNSSPRFELGDQENQISKKEIERIVTEARPLVFGDRLLEYLKLQRAAFINHVHRYPGLKPEDLSGKQDIDKYLEYDLDSLLSKNIKIN